MSLQEQGQLRVFPVAEYTLEMDEAIGRLMPMLDPGFSAEPRPELMQEVIDSPYHDQLVVVRKADQLVVGAASMTLILGRGLGRVGRLEDFVVDEEVRRLGVGSALWDGTILWCRSKGLNRMDFETERDRPAALAFYETKGAVIVKDSLDENALHLQVEV